MKKHVVMMTYAFAASFGYSSASVTLNYTFGVAYTSDGTAGVPDDTLWVMIVDDGDGLLPGGLQVNTSLNSNEDESAIANDFNNLTIAKGSLIGNDRVFDFGGFNGTENFEIAGSISGGTNYSFGPNSSDDFSTADVGNSFGFYWFPGESINGSLQLGTVVEVGGISDMTQSTSTERMIIPSDSATGNPSTTTSDLGGTFPISRFTAIEVPPSGYQIWRDSFFTQIQIDAGEAAPDADPDGDGLANLLEYATGHPPLLSSAAPLTLTRADASSVLLEFNRIADPELRYRVEATDNLGLSPWPDLVFESSGAGNLEELVELSQPLSSGQRFFRLRVDFVP